MIIHCCSRFEHHLEVNEGQDYYCSLNKYKMQTDSIVPSISEAHLHSETIFPHVGDQGIAASTPDHVIEPLPGTILSLQISFLLSSFFIVYSF